MSDPTNDLRDPGHPGDESVEEKVEDAVEDAIEFFEVDSEGSPADDADAPAP